MSRCDMCGGASVDFEIQTSVKPVSEEGAKAIRQNAPVESVASACMGCVMRFGLAVLKTREGPPS